MKKLKIKLLYSFIIIGCFYILYTLFGNVDYSKYNLHTTFVQGKVLSYKIDGDCLQLEIQAKEKMILFYTFSSVEEKNIYSNSIQLGDVYGFYGTLQVPSTNSNFYAFSYQKYLLSKKIYYVMRVEKMTLYKRNHNVFYTLKNFLYHSIEKRRTSSYLVTFLFGDTNLLEESTLQMFRDCGISHLIAISGMHITLFSMILLYLLKWIHFDYIKYPFLIVVLWIYAFLVGFTPSIMRAVFSFTIISVAHLWHRKLDALRVLLCLFFGFLLYNPFYIYHTGFLFSFIVSFFLILSQDILKGYKCYIVKIFLISSIAFLAGIPIIAITFYETNLLAPILNIIFVPLISFIVFPLALLSLLCPWIECVFEFSLSILQDLLVISNTYFTWKLIVPYMNLYWIVGYYIVLFFILYYQTFRYAIFILLFLFFHSYRNLLQRYPIITMIDVGQGDSILIQLPYNQGNVLIDTGGKITYKTEEWRQRSHRSIASSTLIPFFKSIGVHSLKYLILSHGDADHAGEALALLSNFSVENVVMNTGNTTPLEEKIMQSCYKNNISVTFMSEGFLSIGKVRLSFLNKKNLKDENEDSLVLYTKLNEKNILFMGDAGISSEKYIIDEYSLPEMDILKVGHHGSKYSSSTEFIKLLCPKIALISVGENNRYGHPHTQTIETLHATSSAVYQTSIHGMIRLILKDRIVVSTCI